MGTRDTDKDWNKIAKEEPFWGVLSEAKYKKSAINSKAVSQFMESGETYIANLFGLIHKHLIPKFSPKRALDFGCGVGRLVIPLADRANEVVGVDVASSMLELCRDHADQKGLKNITLCESDEKLSLVKGKFQLINSYIVLQHIPPDCGYNFIQSMIDRLEIGGVGSIHITYAKSRKFLIHEQHKAQYYRREGNMLIELIASEQKPPEGTITMFDYDLNQVMAQVSRVSGHPIMTLPTNDDDHLGIHLIFVKARG
jgi:2-polyprenyl-3-methyl-5-hydroxy-6-metoxy-1,4-benzoquinol methylase